MAFRALGVVVIDEQHRFGVEQRAALRGKGDDPDVLVMTATPIPRTAAMTVYGDLDVTVLDEMPPGRSPVVTRWARGELEEAEAYGRVATEVAAGRQAYVVCPLVEESEKVQAKAATAEFARLRDEVWPDLRLALLHGQMPSKEKEAVMAAFRAGELDVLVATTVIEVGRRRPQRHRDDHRGRRPLRHGPAPPAAGPGGPGRRAVVVLPAGRGHHAGLRGPPGGHRGAAPTGSSWPRSTSRSGARAPSSAPARRATAT